MGNCSCSWTVHCDTKGCTWWWGFGSRKGKFRILWIVRKCTKNICKTKVIDSFIMQGVLEIYSLFLLEGAKSSGFGRLIGSLVFDFSLIRWGLLFRLLLPSFHLPRSVVSDDFPANKLLSSVQLRCLRPHSLKPPDFLFLNDGCPIASGSLALDPRVRLKKIRTARRRHNCATPSRFSRII